MSNTSVPGPHPSSDDQQQPGESNVETGEPPELETNHIQLDTDPFADDLTVQLAAVVRRRWTSRTTAVIGAFALLVAGLLAGVGVERLHGTPAATTTASRAAGFAGAGGGGGFAGAGGFAGRSGGAIGSGTHPSAGPNSGAPPSPMTTGTIKRIDGSTIYVQLTNGDVVTVKTTKSTTVNTATSSALRDLKTGQKVSFAGSAGGDGSVAATAVTATQ